MNKFSYRAGTTGAIDSFNKIQNVFMFCHLWLKISNLYSQVSEKLNRAPNASTSFRVKNKRINSNSSPVECLQYKPFIHVISSCYAGKEEHPQRNHPLLSQGPQQST